VADGAAQIAICKYLEDLLASVITGNTFWLYLTQISVLMVVCVIFPLMKLAVYWLLELPITGTDWDTFTDIATFIFWLPWVAWWFATKTPYVDLEALLGAYL